MTERTIQPRAGRAASRSSTRQLVARHPVATFLIACYALNWLVVLPPLRVRGGLPFQLGLWESLGSILGVALLAFLVVAASGGRAGVRDLAGRCLRWRVGVRWYLVALVAPPVALPLGAAALFGAAPRAPCSTSGRCCPPGSCRGCSLGSCCSTSPRRSAGWGSCRRGGRTATGP